MATAVDHRCEALNRECNGLLEVQVPEAGMHLVAWLPAGKDDRVVARLALEQGIEVAPLSTFSVAPLRRGDLMLGYAGATSAALREGVQRLARALRGGRGVAWMGTKTRFQEALPLTGQITFASISMLFSAPVRRNPPARIYHRLPRLSR